MADALAPLAASRDGDHRVTPLQPVVVVQEWTVSRRPAMGNEAVSVARCLNRTSHEELPTTCQHRAGKAGFPEAKPPVPLVV